MLLQEEARLEQEHIRQSAALSATTTLTVNQSNNVSNTPFNRQTSQSSSSSRNTNQIHPKPDCQVCNKTIHEATDY